MTKSKPSKSIKLANDALVKALELTDQWRGTGRANMPVMDEANLHVRAAVAYAVVALTEAVANATNHPPK